MKDKAKIKELKSIAVDFAYHIHLTKQGDVSHNKHIEIFDEWAESKGIYNRPSFDSTVTDEEIEKLQAFKDYVHKRLDDMGIEKDPESEHKAHGCRIGGRLDIIQSRLSQPVRECRCHLQSQQTMCNCQSKPVTGYSEEELSEAIRMAKMLDWNKHEKVPFKYSHDEIIQSLKSKPNNGSNEGATRYGDAVEFHRWMKENEDTQENINLSEWELYTKFKEGRI